ncbi:MAG: hypothetical protein ACLP8S_04090 [Solirubrobacteraceae bacterium]
MNQPTAPGGAQTTRGQGPAFARAWRRRHVDELMEDYVTWREACAAVDTAYESWKGAERQSREIAFGVYTEALDGEQQAASAYQRSVARVAAAQARH